MFRNLHVEQVLDFPCALQIIQMTHFWNFNVYSSVLLDTEWLQKLLKRKKDFVVSKGNLILASKLLNYVPGCSLLYITYLNELRHRDDYNP